MTIAQNLNKKRREGKRYDGQSTKKENPSPHLWQNQPPGRTLLERRGSTPQAETPKAG